MTITRRALVKGAAWSVPVIAVAAAVPSATASAPTELPQKQPVSCTYLGNHGHDGQTAGQWWYVVYDDESTATLDNGTVMSDRALRACAKGGK